MTRMIALITACTLFATSQDANAQLSHRTVDSGHRFLHDHDYWHDDYHAPDLVILDSQADQLAKIARHLHEDAHELSQDYEHSESIEAYVDSLDRLHDHMHEILHEAVEAGVQSTSLTTHIKSDVRQVKSLLSRLYRELQHQGFDGARTNDFRAMVHMRKIIVQDAFPLVRKMEAALYGSYIHDHRIHSYHQPVRSTGWRSEIGLHH